jgi:hypothetical protein
MLWAASRLFAAAFLSPKKNAEYLTRHYIKENGVLPCGPEAGRGVFFKPLLMFLRAMALLTRRPHRWRHGDAKDL